MAAQWTPYRLNLVTRPGEDLRLTFRLTSPIDSMEAQVGGDTYPMILSTEGAQLLIPAGDAQNIPDRAPVTVRVQSGGVWTVLAEGSVVRRTR